MKLNTLKKALCFSFGIVAIFTISADAQWSRNATSGYIYPTNLNDKVGVGTATPSARLDVSNGVIRALAQGLTTYFPTSGKGVEISYISGAGPESGYIISLDRSTGAYKPLTIRGLPLILNELGTNDVVIGSTTPIAGDKLSVYGDATIRGATWVAGSIAKLNLGQGGHNISCIYGTGIQINPCFIPANGGITVRETTGNVGIGTANPGSFKLAVEGKIGCRELIVTTAVWADHVFKPGYTLKPLNEVETFIKANKHLEGIPTEKEAIGKGVAVGEMQVKMLEKIEELTLHMISLQKENARLAARLEQVEKNR